ncbi:MAG: FecR domain-containing protein [Deltaproteobacteria bacterium]|nr:FecR domain-containing protein [Deltaproteobacteria bacterium]
MKTAIDGRALLKLTDGTRLTVGNLSEIELTGFLLRKQERSATITLSTGKIRAVVGKFAGRSNVEVKTATAIAGVRGTDFIVMNQGSANVLFGESDEVSVTGEDGDGVVLKPGMMTESTSGSAPIAPVKVDPGSALEEVREGLRAVTDLDLPADWEKTGILPNLLARWNINYGHYLADSQRFKEALDVFKIAIDLSELPGIKAEARLERGTVLSRNLNRPEDALVEYMDVVRNYPGEPFVGNALFSAGIIHMELGEKAEAQSLLRRYIDEFPEGIHRDTAELFIKALETDSIITLP